MALVVYDRVQETTATTGTGTITLGGAVAGYQSFAVVGNGNTTFYCIVNSSAWEVGIGTYSSTGPTLARTTILSNSNNNGSPITLVGASNVFVTYPSSKSVYEDASGNVSPLGTITSGVWNGTTIGVAYGGTGVTTSSGANSVMIRDANQNVAVNRLNQSNTNTTAAGGVTALTTASSYIHTLVGTGGQTYTMPDATTLSTGVAFLFNNRSTGTLTLQDYATGAIGTIAAGGAAAVFLTINATAGGTWDLHGYLPEGVTWGTNALNLDTTVITNGTWQGGTIQSGYGGTGLTTFAAANNALYSTSASALAAGTLPVAAGGTGTTTAFTAGSVLFAGTSGTYSQDNANFFWDDTNNRLGIGTTSPATRIQISNDSTTLSANNFITIQNRGTNTTDNTNTYPVGGILFSGFRDVRNPANIAGIWAIRSPAVSGASSAGALAFGTTSTPQNIGTDAALPAEQMRLDASGNLGLGVTPSAWISSQKALEVSGWSVNAGSISSSLTTNAYINASSQWIYKATGFSTTYSNASGQHLWYTAPSGTAGTAVTFSERMRLDVSGNLGIGTSSPTIKLQVNVSAGTNGFLVTDTVASDFMITPGVTTGVVRVGPTAGAMAFYSANTERMRIDSAGNVGIATTTPRYKLSIGAITSTGSATPDTLDLGGTYSTTAGANAKLRVYWDNTSTYGFGVSSLSLDYIVSGPANHTFYTNGSERMRLFSSGGLSLGNTTDPGASNLSVTGTSTFSAGTASLPAITTTGDTNTGIFFPAADTIAFTEGGAESMRINSNGNVGIGNTSPTAKIDTYGGASYFAGNFNVLAEAYGPNSISAKSAYDLAGTVVTIGTNTNAVNAGALINFNAYNSTSGATGAFCGAVAGATGNGPANFVIGRRTATQAWAESLRVDTAGNVGIGITPNTWTLTIPAIQIGTSGAFLAGQSSGSAVYLGANIYYNSGWVYRSTDYGSFYSQVGGAHYWYTAPSGTAGTSATLTEQMRMTNGGAVAIGATSGPSAAAIKLVLNSATGVGGGVTFAYSGGAGGAITPATGSGLLFFTTTGTLGSEVYTERMRIASTGNVGIGTISPTYKLDVATIAVAVSQSGGVRFGASDQYGFRLNQYTTAGGVPYAQIMGPQDSNGWLAFTQGTADAERMRIHGTGGVSIGNTTDPGASNLSVTGTGAFGSTISATASAAAAVEGVFTNSSAGATSSAGVRGIGNSTGYFLLRQYGTGVTGTSVFGQTLANWSLLLSDGASSNGLMLGSNTADPVIIGTNNAERMRIFSTGGVSIGNTTDRGAGALSVTSGVYAESTGPFMLNATTVSANFTIPTNFNASSAGPITVNTGITVTVSTGSTWVII